MTTIEFKNISKLLDKLCKDLVTIVADNEDADTLSDEFRASLAKNLGLDEEAAEEEEEEEPVKGKA